MSALALAPQLAASRMRHARGGAILDAFAVVAFGLSTALVLTVSGGTWMFLQRRLHPTQAMADALQATLDQDMMALQVYVYLSCLACGLLIVPILTLGGAAARLGAQARARRLASLRLLGVTSGEVLGMAVFESAVQAALGIVSGSVLYLVTLPSWGAVTFQGVRIAPGEMLLPWWISLPLLGVVLLLAALSPVVGLQRVRISPLGVVRQVAPRAMRAWRAVLMAAALALYVVAAFGLKIVRFEWGTYSVLLAMLMMMVGAVNLVGPWVLQLLARLGLLLDSVPALLAARRIVDDPRAAWRNVGALATLSLAAGFMCAVPVNPDPNRRFGYDVFVGDLRTGVLITLGIGMVLAACGTTIAQASAVFDRADEVVALDRMGVPVEVIHATRLREVLVPELLVTLVCAGLGALMAVPFVLTAQLTFVSFGLVYLALVLGAGFGLAVAGSELSRPLVRQVLAVQRRRDD